MFVLKTIIDQCNAVNERLFSCFVDFQKAFDTVIHTGIKLKLLEIDVGTQSLFYNIIKNMYAASKSCIKINNEVADYFETKLGVEQGDNLTLIYSKSLLMIYPNIYRKHLISYH
jgi:hypothetical protein